MKEKKSERIYRYRFTVTPDLLDGYHHVNNARYLELYERARWAILEESGMGREYMEKYKVGPVILEVSVRFSHEMVPGQEIEVITRSSVRNDLIFTIDQEMYDEQGRKCSYAKFTSSLFDLEKRKMIKASKEWLLAFGIEPD